MIEYKARKLFCKAFYDLISGILLEHWICPNCLSKNVGRYFITRRFLDVNDVQLDEETLEYLDFRCNDCHDVFNESDCKPDNNWRDYNECYVNTKNVNKETEKYISEITSMIKDQYKWDANECKLTRLTLKDLRKLHTHLRKEHNIEFEFLVEYPIHSRGSTPDIAKQNYIEWNDDLQHIMPEWTGRYFINKTQVLLDRDFKTNLDDLSSLVRQLIKNFEKKLAIYEEYCDSVNFDMQDIHDLAEIDKHISEIIKILLQEGEDNNVE